MPTLPRLVTPTVLTGVTMAAYLLLRPYGDLGADTEIAHAFASQRWVIAHLCGATALASFAWLATRMAQVLDDRDARRAAVTGVLGAAFVLPYYGAETFGLHALGRQALETDLSVLDAVDQVRYQPLAVTLFGSGLVLLAASAVLSARAWQRMHQGQVRWAAWPLAVAVVCVLPQFFLPAAGRVVFGFAYLAAAALLVAGLTSSDRMRRPAVRATSKPGSTDGHPASASPRR